MVYVKNGLAMLLLLSLLPMGINASDDEYDDFYAEDTAANQEIQNIMQSELNATDGDYSAANAELEQGNPHSSVATSTDNKQIQKAAPVYVEAEVITTELDTIDSDSEGNWLYKRLFYDKAKEYIDKIRDLVGKIVDARMHFFEEQVKLYRTRLDPFYVAIGFDQGQLTELVNHLLNMIKHEREQEGALNPNMLEQYDKVLAEKVTLESLRLAVNDIQQKVNSFDDAFRGLIKEVNRARNYEKEAYRLLDKINLERNHHVAQNDYREINAIWHNVKNIGSYIRGDFSKHFFELGSVILERIKQVQNELELLKSKGIVLIKENIEEEHLHDEAQQCAIEHEEDVDEDDEEEEVQQVGWFTWILQLLASPFLFLWRVIKNLFSR